MTSFSTPFREIEEPDRPVWNSKYPVVPLHPIGVSVYYGNAGDFVDYDGSIAKNPGGGYPVVEIGPSFFAVLRPYRFEGGRSAANVRLQDVHRFNKTYLMSAYDYITELANSGKEHGIIRGEWKFTKKGSNYRISLIRHIN